MAVLALFYVALLQELWQGGGCSSVPLEQRDHPSTSTWRPTPIRIFGIPKRALERDQQRSHRATLVNNPVVVSDVPRAADHHGVFTNDRIVELTSKYPWLRDLLFQERRHFFFPKNHSGRDAGASVAWCNADIAESCKVFSYNHGRRRPLVQRKPGVAPVPYSFGNDTTDQQQPIVRVELKLNAQKRELLLAVKRRSAASSSYLLVAEGTEEGENRDKSPVEDLLQAQAASLRAGASAPASTEDVEGSSGRYQNLWGAKFDARTGVWRLPPPNIEKERGAADSSSRQTRQARGNWEIQIDGDVSSFADEALRRKFWSFVADFGYQTGVDEEDQIAEVPPLNFLRKLFLESPQVVPRLDAKEVFLEYEVTAHRPEVGRVGVEVESPHRKRPTTLHEAFLKANGYESASRWAGNRANFWTSRIDVEELQLKQQPSVLKCAIDHVGEMVHETTTSEGRLRRWRKRDDFGGNIATEVDYSTADGGRDTSKPQLTYSKLLLIEYVNYVQRKTNGKKIFPDIYRWYWTDRLTAGSDNNESEDDEAARGSSSKKAVYLCLEMERIDTTLAKLPLEHAIEAQARRTRPRDQSAPGSGTTPTDAGGDAPRFLTSREESLLVEQHAPVLLRTLNALRATKHEGAARTSGIFAGATVRDAAMSVVFRPVEEEMEEEGLFDDVAAPTIPIATGGRTEDFYVEDSPARRNAYLHAMCVQLSTQAARCSDDDSFLASFADRTTTDFSLKNLRGGAIAFFSDPEDFGDSSWVNELGTRLQFSEADWLSSRLRAQLVAGLAQERERLAAAWVRFLRTDGENLVEAIRFYDDAVPVDAEDQDVAIAAAAVGARLVTGIVEAQDKLRPTSSSPATRQAVDAFLADGRVSVRQVLEQHEILYDDYSPENWAVAVDAADGAPRDILLIDVASVDFFPPTSTPRERFFETENERALAREKYKSLTQRKWEGTLLRNRKHEFDPPLVEEFVGVLVEPEVEQAQSGTADESQELESGYSSFLGGSSGRGPAVGESERTESKEEALLNPSETELAAGLWDAIYAYGWTRNSLGAPDFEEAIRALVAFSSAVHKALARVEMPGYSRVSGRDPTVL
ncbi:unnamed protein product [Amoebophrya sp. A120]|nr:unnamed protein product [Amoebophrya sp. A120]|eukprot:GSA120T00017062001.1